MAPQTFKPRDDAAGVAEEPGRDQAKPSERVGSQQMLDRAEFIRILQQALRNLGFSDIAERLERESGIEMQPPVVNAFQHAIAGGDFDGALRLLPELTNNEPTRKQARFMILQQKFIEQVDRGATAAALHILRHEMGPLQINQHELKRLAGCLLQTADDAGNRLLRRGPWDAMVGDTRDGLMRRLQQQLPPALLVPEARLERLLEHAVRSQQQECSGDKLTQWPMSKPLPGQKTQVSVLQVEKCICHNCPDASFSLLTDYTAGVEQLPSHLHRVLYEHKDEVWHLQFSHTGDRLASASKDQTALIWRVSPDGAAAVQHVLAGHLNAVSHLAWSPDDSRLLTCSGQQVKVWDTRNGECVHTIQHHKEHTTACVWFPNGQKFLTSGADRWIYMCDQQGRVLRRWEMKDRVNDLALIPDADVIVCVTADRFIQLMRLSDHVPVTSIGDEATVGPSAITSISLTPDGEFLLANLRSHTGHLWKVGPIARRIAKPPPEGGSGGDPYGLAPEEDEDEKILDEPVMEYHAGETRVGRYVIRSCIGGLNSAFVASGSEDCRVYIWHRDTGAELAQLDGHSGTVNGVAWNPAHPHMLASASDDKTIGIWIAPAWLAGPGGRGSYKSLPPGNR